MRLEAKASQTITMVGEEDAQPCRVVDSNCTKNAEVAAILGVSVFGMNVNLYVFLCPVHAALWDKNREQWLHDNA